MYRTLLWCAFLHAAALRASSLSELEISSRDSVSSLPEPFSSSSASAGPSSLSPKKTTSRDAEWDHSGLPEPLPGDPVPDSSSKLDLDRLEVPGSDALESEEEGLDLKPQ